MAYNLSDINRAVRSDPRGFVEESDAAFNKKIRGAAEKIGGFMETATAKPEPEPEPPDPPEESRCKVIPFERVG